MGIARTWHFEQLSPQELQAMQSLLSESKYTYWYMLFHTKRVG
jgi:hypothetical protein